jgi:hypothetical protein
MALNEIQFCLLSVLQPVISNSKGELDVEAADMPVFVVLSAASLHHTTQGTQWINCEHPEAINFINFV